MKYLKSILNIDGLYTVIRVDRRAPVWPSGLLMRLPALRPEFESRWLLFYEDDHASI